MRDNNTTTAAVDTHTINYTFSAVLESVSLLLMVLLVEKWSANSKAPVRMPIATNKTAFITMNYKRYKRHTSTI